MYHIYQTRCLVLYNFFLQCCDEHEALVMLKPRALIGKLHGVLFQVVIYLYREKKTEKFTGVQKQDLNSQELD